jgi:uncharacterized protein YkwD
MARRPGLDRRAVLWGGLLATATMSGCSVSGLFSLSQPADGARIVTGEALGRINAFRAEHGFSALVADRAAAQAALDHARRMAAHRTMAHNVGLGADFGRRMRAARVAAPAAENIAAGQQQLEGALQAWERSASHRANTLDPRFVGVGVAVAFDGSRDNRPYWAMILSGG